VIGDGSSREKGDDRERECLIDEIEKKNAAAACLDAIWSISLFHSVTFQLRSEAHIQYNT
jgi:hypothetical protein